MPLVLLVGGVRSGKSRLAAELVSREEAPVVAIVTAEARDDEMAARIARHRADRPGSWMTVEEPLELPEAVLAAPDDAAVLLDCLTLWVSNLMEHELADDEIETRARTAAELAAKRSPLVVAVTNEVGSGVIPESALGRRFSDLLGSVNAIWAQAAERTALVVAGKVLPLHGAEALRDA